MPVSIVAGAQFGSEGKGKVTHHFAMSRGVEAVVRVGGPNSGHTVVRDGGRMVFQQLPVTAGLGPVSVLPAGSYINPEILQREIETAAIGPDSLAIDSNAVVISEADRLEESRSGLTARIGSTGSGTGAAAVRRMRRDGSSRRAVDVDFLRPFIVDTTDLLRSLLDAGKRVMIEGTQGFGLSILHGGHRDFSTSRDTTAAGFLAEAGLSPLDVDDVILVMRAFPIRVAGESGPLSDEITWEQVGASSGRSVREFTTVTRKLRRVARFDPEIVRRAISYNRPTSLVMNHLDYFADLATADGADAANQFLAEVEGQIDRRIDFIGVSDASLIIRDEFGSATQYDKLGRSA